MILNFVNTKIRYFALIIVFFGAGLTIVHAQSEIIVKPFVDTTTAEFNGVFNHWKNYTTALMSVSFRQDFSIKNSYEKINPFWVKEDVEKYNFPDLIATVISSPFPYYLGHRTHFLGFSKRNDSLFEMKICYIPDNDSLFHGAPLLIITQPLMKQGDDYKLINKFTCLQKQGQIITKVIDSITYYYSPLYDFDIDGAQTLSHRIESFIDDFQIDTKIHINYLTASNMTEINQWFGIDYFATDFNCTLSTTRGKALNNRMVLSAGGGENYMHEIIHIYLEEIRDGNYNLFEEGIACYFGDHQMKSYQFHAKRLKNYLNQNNWVDLSKNLSGYYNDENGKLNYELNNPTSFYSYGDDITNFSYIIHSVLCEIAYKQGGAKKVMTILQEKCDNVDEMYAIIEKHLDIKQKDIDKEIRAFLETNY